ncbi:MAG TPA: HIT domain-containing protein [Thermomicrobiaceae bacterium]|nr:HIT domain-containing protein [Thermomicrobiaceae bacterium]
MILYRGSAAFIIMNLYPYNTGHVMVVPYAHAAELDQLAPEEVGATFGLLPWVTAAQRRALRCEGINIGLNLGSVAGAGVAEHLHIHVVPRWQGDANFMPILANTMVLPELLPVTYAKLRAELAVSGLGMPPGEQLLPQAGAVVSLPALGKVALRRASDGSMVLPKGHIEAGEAAWQTAEREVREEMGLIARVAGWAGTLRVTSRGIERLVALVTATAEPAPEFADHLGQDTFLFTPEEAVSALSHEPARALLRETLNRGSWTGAGL